MTKIQQMDKIHIHKSGQADDTPVEKCVISQTKQGDYYELS